MFKEQDLLMLRKRSGLAAGVSFTLTKIFDYIKPIAILVFLYFCKRDRFSGETISRREWHEDTKIIYHTPAYRPAAAKPRHGCRWHERHRRASQSPRRDGERGLPPPQQV